MTILQAGVPKSGNYWIYNIIASIARHGGIKPKSFIQNHPIHRVAQTWELSFAGQSNMDFLTIESHGCYFRISAVFRERIQDIDDYIRQCSHVWTHSGINRYSREILAKFDKIVYIIRDPRDVAISYSKFAFTPHKLKNHPPHYEKDPASYLAHNLDAMTRKWVQHVGGYLQYRDTGQIYPIFYERLLHSFDTELLGLSTYLGIDLDQNAIDQIKNEVAFSTMKQKSPSHLRKGKTGEWRQGLTGAQKRQVEQIAGPMLALLNYPVSEADDSLPYLPPELSHDGLKRAIAPSEPTIGLRLKQIYDFATSTRTLKAKASLVRDWTWEIIKSGVQVEQFRRVNNL